VVTGVEFSQNGITDFGVRLTAVGRKVGKFGVPGDFVKCYISVRENLMTV
jgi:hypothetical protein